MQSIIINGKRIKVKMPRNDDDAEHVFQLLACGKRLTWRCCGRNSRDFETLHRLAVANTEERNFLWKKEYRKIR